MKQFRWILLSGLLVAATQIAQAQPPAGDPRSSSMSPSSSTGSTGGSATGSAADAGAITNTTTTTTTTGVAPDGTNGDFVDASGAAFGDTTADSSSMPNTGGEPMIAVLAGLSIAGAALAMRRKVTA